MLISRSDRGALARWWFTIDRPLISAVLLLMSMGVLISMAASPPVAERIGLDTFHFFKSQLFYLTFFAVIGLIVLSFFDVNWVRRAALIGFAGALALMVAALFFGPEIKGPIAGSMSARSACSRLNLRSPAMSQRQPGFLRSGHAGLTCPAISLPMAWRHFSLAYW
jgi:hypothetical protein